MRKFVRTSVLVNALQLSAALLISGVAFVSHAQNTKSSATRIVSLGGSITEIVFALGAGSQVVAVDQSSHLPTEVEKLPKVGVFRSISAEGILALKPTVIVGTADVGPPTAVTQLKSAGVQVQLVPVAENIEGALAKIRGVAAVLGRKAAGDKLASMVSEDVARVSAVAARAKAKPKVLFVYARGGGNLFVAGTKSMAEEMIALAYGQNAITGFTGFKPLTAEAVVAAAPDVILIPTRGLESIGGIDGLLKLPGIAQTPAGKAKRVVSIDDELMLGFGPRVGLGLRELTVGLHPELASYVKALPAFDIGAVIR